MVFALLITFTAAVFISIFYPRNVKNCVEITYTNWELLLETLLRGLKHISEPFLNWTRQDSLPSPANALLGLLGFYISISAVRAIFNLIKDQIPYLFSTEIFGPEIILSTAMLGFFLALSLHSVEKQYIRVIACSLYIVLTSTIIMLTYHATNEQLSFSTSDTASTQAIAAAMWVAMISGTEFFCSYVSLHLLGRGGLARLWLVLFSPLYLVYALVWLLKSARIALLFKNIADQFITICAKLPELPRRFKTYRYENWKRILVQLDIKQKMDQLKHTRIIVETQRQQREYLQTLHHQAEAKLLKIKRSHQYKTVNKGLGVIQRKVVRQLRWMSDTRREIKRIAIDLIQLVRKKTKQKFKDNSNPFSNGSYQGLVDLFSNRPSHKDD